MARNTEDRFKSSNRDTLKDLAAGMARAEKRVQKARKALNRMQAKLRPFEEKLRAAEGEWMNVAVRLKVWRHEYADHLNGEQLQVTERPSQRHVNLVDAPLNQFKPGQSLCFRFYHNSHSITCSGKFIRIVRGTVELEILPGWEPDWFRECDVQKRYPGMIARTRPRNIFLWGKSPDDTYTRCHWFKNLTDPAT
jgi:hypothetical protein